ncbi:DNA-directed RNA polymerase subunit A'' [Halobacteriales archaeon QH_8_67_36]|nr:MAG: DNA-directed RNA polymerase subunit A'' [Halobacteriales archaeon QH_8_67_36]
MVSDDIEAVVEDTALPRRLKDDVYSTVEDRGVGAEDADRIAQAVESRYMQTRVDPLDPVGTVSAQSIGEPGTQMSIPGDERVVVRRNGETDVVEIGSLVDGLLEVRDSRTIDDHEVARGPSGMEVLSLRADENVEWKPLDEVSRHDAPEELLRFELESGRSIRATKAHSFVVKDSNEIVPIASEELDVGDELPVVGTYDGQRGEADLTTLTRPAATDGGTAVQAASDGETVVGRACWDRIESIEIIEPDDEYVYDFSVSGLETFTTAQGVVTHNTMNTFHYAGVAEIDVTQGLPRLIELVDARKTPDTPMMTVHLDEEYADDREKAHEVVWKIEATRILALGDISTNVADMLVRIDLNEETLQERWPTVGDTEAIAEEIAETIESTLGVSTRQAGTVIEFGPEEPSYRDLLQLVEELRDIVFKGIDEITRVVIRKEEVESGEEFVLYTEGSDFGEVLGIEGVDASRTTCNNIHEIYRSLGVEAARETLINETMNTLEEQGLDDVNVRHLMLVADIMTNEGTIESIGRHGISGSKDSVLARAAFEVTVNHLLDAAIHGEIDELDGVTENVIVGKPIKLGTGDVDLRMGTTQD